MRKLTLLLVVLFLFGTVFAVTAEEEEEATMEERVAALEAEESPLEVSGSLDFSLTDSTETAYENPHYSVTKSATAELKVETKDEKVSASMTMDLNPSVSSTFNYGDSNVHAYESTTISGTDMRYDKYSDNYQAYVSLQSVIGFYNSHAEDETAKDEKDIWAGTDVETELEAALKSGTLDMIHTDDEADEVLLKSAVADDPTDGEEFAWTTSNAGEVATYYGNILTNGTPPTGVMIDNVTDAIDNILSELSTKAKGHLPNSAGGNYNYTSDGLQTDLDNLTEAQIDDWTADDKALVKQAVDLEYALIDLMDPSTDHSVTSELSDFITSASVTLKEIGGVADVTLNISGQHASAGSINVDGSGHTSTAVSGYPSMNVALSSGVVEGLSAGATLYIDDNNMKDEITDDWYTWLDESAGTPEEPKYGMDMNLGYTYNVSEDMSVGADTTFALYDVIDGDNNYAFSIAPSFSGMGAGVSGQFDYAYDGTMYGMADVSYSVAGFTPSVNFHYAASGDDYSVAYSAAPASVMAEVKNDGGMAFGLNLKSDLTEYVGFKSSLSGGFTMGMPEDGDNSNAWNVGLSVMPMSGLTLALNADADTVEGSTFDYSGKISYEYGAATVYTNLASDYNSTDDDEYFTYTIGTSVKF